MLKDLENNPICAVCVDESVPCVSVTWRRYATSTQLRFVHENVIHLLQKHGLMKIFGNDTRLPTIHSDDQTWIVRDWMPRALAAGLRAVASKRPEEHFGRVSVDGIMAAVAPHLLIRSFNDLEQARGWLKGSPPQSAEAHPLQDFAHAPGLSIQPAMQMTMPSGLRLHKLTGWFFAPQCMLVTGPLVA